MTLSVQRRRFLMGLAAAGVGVGAGVFPLLSRAGLWNLLQGSRAGDQKLKVVFYVLPDGLGTSAFNAPTAFNSGGIWHPTAGADSTAFELNKSSAQLASYRANALYTRNSVVTIYGGGNSGHAAWETTLRDSAKSQSSIDVLLGNEFKGPGGRRVVYAGPHTGGNPYFVSYEGTSRQVPQLSPLLLFDQLFGGEKLTTANSGTRSAKVLDAVLGDLNDMKSRIGAGEKQKIDTHLDAVQQLITDLGDSTPPPDTGCSDERPSLPGTDMMSPVYRTQVHEAHNKVVATALGCGLMRVATVQVAASSEQLNILDVSSTRAAHDLAHLSGTGTSEDDRKQWEEGRMWYVARFRQFLDQLAAQRDPDVEGDSLLDHTLVVLTSEMSDGSPEHCFDMPLTFFGGKHTPLDTGGGKGRWIDLNSQADLTFWDNIPKQVSMQRMWATLARAAGIAEVPYAGNTDTVTGLFTNVSGGHRFA